MNDKSITYLTHSLTPTFLRLINDKINAELQSQDSNTESLYFLMVLRHKLILREINRLSGKQRKSFVTLEMEKNKRLELDISKLHQEAKSQVIKLKRADNAIKRYKK